MSVISKINIFQIELTLVILTAIFLLFTSNQLYLATIPSYIIKNFDNKTDNIKHILMWNSYLEKGWRVKWNIETFYEWIPGQEGFINSGCEENRCVITDNRTARPISLFDAIIFHQRAFRWEDAPDAKYRKKTQKYIHFTNEAPTYLYYDKTSLKTMDNFFNWTFTYRQDSTFTQPYGTIRQVKPHPTGSSLQTYISSFGVNNTYLAKSKNSSASITWFASNCHSESNREELVKKLQKYMAVDIYGRCGTKTCPKYQSNQCLQGYKFYLSLENSVCQDYITEKFFFIAQQPIIPITLNGVKMAELAPPHSYINVLDFPTVKDLANYLTLLTQNDALYASYFWWKDFYRVISGYLVQGYCDICQALHEENKNIKSSRISAPSNMYKWWFEDAKCYKPTFITE